MDKKYIKDFHFHVTDVGDSSVGIDASHTEIKINIKGYYLDKIGQELFEKDLKEFFSGSFSDSFFSCITDQDRKKELEQEMESEKYLSEIEDKLAKDNNDL